MGSIQGGLISLTGGGSSSGGSNSGIQTINGELGPSISIIGGSGIQVTTSNNVIIIDASGTGNGTVTKFAASFTNITSGLFTHSIGTRDVVVAVYDNSGPPKEIMPDEIILENLDQIGVKFNRPQSGRVVVLG